MGQRICPECKQKTAERKCPSDGYSTVPADLYAEGGDDPLIGREFEGRYRIEGVIGRGGFGAVYQAIQLAVDRRVAIKVMRPQHIGDLDQVRRFQNEARVVSRLEHPHSLRVYDFGQTDEGTLYLVTELLEGEPLSTVLKRERALAPERAVKIACQALDGLAEAHERGLVHRDIKPDNLFLIRTRSGDESVKVLDFGIVKAMGDDSAIESLTRTGNVVGTPAYMSPEQARGDDVDTRSDLYSIGIVLYRMLTGERPFSGANPMDILLSHIRTPAPRIAMDSIPAALCDVVAQCLMKSAADRPATADILASRLQAGLRGEPPTTAATAATPRLTQRPADGTAEMTSGVDHTITSVSPSAVVSDRDARPPFLWIAVGGAAALLVVGLVVWQPWAAGPAPPDPAPPAPALAPVAEAPTPPPEPPAKVAPRPAVAAAPPRVVRPAQLDTARAERSEIEVELRPAPAVTAAVVETVELTSTPPGAVVFDGRRRLGKTPLRVTPPAVGSRELKVKRPGYRAARVTLRSDQKVPVQVKLRSAPKAADQPFTVEAK